MSNAAQRLARLEARLSKTSESNFAEQVQSVMAEILTNPEAYAAAECVAACPTAQNLEILARSLDSARNSKPERTNDERHN